MTPDERYPGDLGWVAIKHGEFQAAELGFGTGFEAYVAGSSPTTTTRTTADRRQPGSPRSVGTVGLHALCPHR